MATPQKRYVELSDMNNQRVAVVTVMITHLKEHSPQSTQIHLVGGGSVTVRGTMAELTQTFWP